MKNSGRDGGDTHGAASRGHHHNVGFNSPIAVNEKPEFRRNTASANSLGKAWQSIQAILKPEANMNANQSVPKPPALETVTSRELETVEGGIIGGCIPSMIPSIRLPGPIPPFRDVFAKVTIGRV